MFSCFPGDTTRKWREGSPGSVSAVARLCDVHSLTPVWCFVFKVRFSGWFEGRLKGTAHRVGVLKVGLKGWFEVLVSGWFGVCTLSATFLGVALLAHTHSNRAWHRNTRTTLVRKLSRGVVGGSVSDGISALVTITGKCRVKC